MIKVNCNLCGCDNYSIVYKTYSGDLVSGEKYYKITDHEINAPVRIVKCRKCGLIYANPRPQEDVLMGSYTNSVDEEYIVQERGRRISAGVLLKFLKKTRVTGNRILDIGCSAGFLLDEAKKGGWDPYGVELSKWASDFAKNKLGLENIFCGTLFEAHYPVNYFDAVVLIDSIEHLTDPKGVLTEIRRILKPSGMLCVNTPNFNSLLSKILGAKWWGVKRFHLYYFSPHTLVKMLKNTGFYPLRVRSHSRTFTLNYWIDRICMYNKSFKRLFFLFYKLNWPLKKNVRFNLGDQFEVFARKERRLEFLGECEDRETVTEKKTMKTVVVLPAFNAAKTLRKTVEDIPKDIVDDIILVDDASRDDTVDIAKKLGLKVFVHKNNSGYGRNQKTCYTEALKLNADIIVMVHPDYQYDPKVIPELIEPIQRGVADAVFGSRMMKRGALEGGMPLWKHNANVLLTAFENVILGASLSEYHSGFRAYSAKYLKSIKFMLNSDGFIFDTEIIIQGLLKFMRIEEVPIRTRYFDEASSIRFFPCILYGLGILKTLMKYVFHKNNIFCFKQFE